MASFLKKIALVSVCTLLCAAPIGVAAFSLIPCDGVTVKCEFPQLVQMIQNIVNFLFILIAPVAIIVFSIAGFKILIAGSDSGARNDAKRMFGKMAMGIVWMMAAWLLVYLITNVLLKDEFKDLPVKLGYYNEIL